MYLPITTRQLADGTAEIAPSGEIDLDNAHVMRDAVNDVLTASTPGKICLDLQRVMLIDSIGIGILVACFHTAAASGVKLVVSHPEPDRVPAALGVRTGRSPGLRRAAVAAYLGGSAPVLILTWPARRSHRNPGIHGQESLAAPRPMNRA